MKPLIFMVMLVGVPTGFPAAGPAALKDRINAQSRFGAAMKRGFQTRDAEMALARMVGDLVDR
jgi:hypothetical protein